MIEPESIVDYATAKSDAEGDYLYRLCAPPTSTPCMATWPQATSRDGY